MIKLDLQPSASGSPGAHPSPSELPALGAELQSALGQRFHVQRPVAIGGMATVFQLSHTLHHGLFAAKVLHRSLAQRPGVLTAFRNEAVHAALLAPHPNAVPIFDYLEAESSPHGPLAILLMPFLAGEDLDHLLARRGALPRDEALFLAAQVASLLAHAKSVGVVHGDLTPGNLRLDPFGRYRVLDLGLASSHSLPAPRTFLGGTPLYTSPEQAAGHPATHRSDLYSLGVLLAEALTGRPLFAAPTLAEVARLRDNGLYTLPPVIQQDGPVCLLLQRLLALRPADRLTSAFALAGALAALGFPRPELHQPLHTSDHPQRRRPRLT